MIDRITIRERGVVPRRLKKLHNTASKEAWQLTGKLFHRDMRDKRFSAEHGRKAGYKPRSGEQAGTSGRAFWRSYTGQKLRKYHHKRPLEYSGNTRSRVRAANVSATAKGVRVAYPGANTFNFRNPHSQINMAEEFRKLIPEEIGTLAAEYDRRFEAAMKADQTTSTIQV